MNALPVVENEEERAVRSYHARRESTTPDCQPQQPHTSIREVLAEVRLSLVASVMVEVP